MPRERLVVAVRPLRSFFSEERLSALQQEGTSLARPVPWPRIFAEGLAIIVSILLAFGIQAWWEDRQQRQEERILLAGLLVDLRDDSTDYAMAAAEQHRRVLAADLLLSLVGEATVIDEGAAEADPDEMSPGAALNQLGRGPRLETVRVSYDQITSAGISRVIKDPELRQRIARYYARAADITEPMGVNGQTQAANEAFESELRRLGFTSSDGDGIPVGILASNPTLRAVIRSSRSTSQFAAGMAKQLHDVVVGLLREVEAYLA